MIYSSDQAGPLMGALGSLGQGVGQAVGEAKKRRHIQRSGDLLGQILGELPEDASIQDVTQALGEYHKQGGEPSLANAWLKDTWGPSFRTKQDPIRRAQFNENQKLVSGIRNDAKIARDLLKDAQPVYDAIVSGNVIGEGLQAAGQAMMRYLTSSGTTRDEQLLNSIRKKTLMSMGDFKGIRPTDQKLRMLETSLFQEGKSQEANEEAFRLWFEELQKMVKYQEEAARLLKEDPDLIYDINFRDMVEGVSAIEGTSGLEMQRESPQQKVYDSLPDASMFKGKIARDPDTGMAYESDGTKWIEVK